MHKHRRRTTPTTKQQQTVFATQHNTCIWLMHSETILEQSSDLMKVSIYTLNGRFYRSSIPLGL